MQSPVYSFVVPVFCESETVSALAERLREIADRLDGESEFILIDDGSTDDSLEKMLGLSADDSRFTVIELSRNFGHQIAISAGIDKASGEAIIIMDADLQDPPEVVLEMAASWREGSEIVYGVREEREGESVFKRLTASVFYRIMRKLTDLEIPVDAGDFRLVDRKALDAFKSMREHNRYVRGMFSWVGFRQTGVTYKRSKRFAGKTKYPFRKMMRLAVDGAVSFSTLPLRLALHLGFLIAGLSFVYGIWAVGQRLLGYDLAPGWASLFTAVTFLSGIQLVVIGILGEYVGRIYDEVRNRPLYIVRHVHGEKKDAGG